MRVGASAVALAAGVALVGIAVPAQAADPITLNILTVNDFHGRINSSTVQFAGTIEGLRAADGANGANTLLVGAGDFIGASEFTSASAQDQPTIDVFNELGMVASAVGNHEFDQGWADLRDRVVANKTNAKWDYLGANVYLTGTETPALPEYGIYQAGGLNVAVIGVVTQETPTLVSPSGVSGLTFGDPVAAINRVADRLTDGDPANGEADVLIASVHEGATDGAQSLAANEVLSPVFANIVNTTSPKVAAIINGHTHQTYAYQAPVPGSTTGQTRPVLQTGNYATNVGQIQLTVERDSKTVSGYTVKNVPRVTTDAATLIGQYPSLQAVKTTVDNAIAAAAVIGNRPVGTLTADITTAIPNPAAPPSTSNRDDRAKESTLGNLVADALLATLSPPDRGGAQITVVNPGGLRAELLYAKSAANAADADGTILYAEANGILPFINNLATVDMTGAQVKTMLEQQWQRDAAGNIPSRPYLQLGTNTGFTYTFDAALPEGSRITSMMLNGAPIDPATTYRIGTFTFLTGLGTTASGGGDNFRVFTQATNLRDSGLIDRDAWIAYLGAHQPVSPSFAKHGVSVSGLNTSPAAGSTQSFSVSNLDLTSSGAPANTTLTASFGPSADGVGAVPVGTATVTGGAATLSITLPTTASGAGYLILDAAPSGTRSIIPLQVSLPASTVTATAAPAQYGTGAKIAVTVASPGQTPTGTVTVTDAGGAALGSATLAAGKATVTLGRTALAPGTQTLTVTYSGSTTIAPSSTTVDVVVAKAKSSTYALNTSFIVRKGQLSNVLVVSVANGVAVDGQVTVSYNGQTVGTGTISNGTANVQVAGFPSWGLKILTVSYAGSDTVAGSKATAAVLVF
ncbi:5'-nucleotidase C-terminal domain-containing protein [uncultured Microbacterium sp.]|uniref:5'-nucleotidase C-terminal domain-containing protein n=1 Tax=uncultured Microbacterium sp. TaxID=191216 RepID=UPI0035CB373E